MNESEIRIEPPDNKDIILELEDMHDVVKMELRKELYTVSVALPTRNRVPRRYYRLGAALSEAKSRSRKLDGDLVNVFCPGSSFAIATAHDGVVTIFYNHALKACRDRFYD